MLLKDGRRISYPVVGYLLLLLQFAVLGTFVAALAFGSELAVVAGVAWAACLVGAVLCFRIGSRRLTSSREAGDPGHNQTIWSEPLRQDEVDQYHLNFRGGRQTAKPVTAIASRSRQRAQPARVETDRLSA